MVSRRLYGLVFAALLWAGPALAGASHGLALFGELKYGADYAHFDYVNPKAPKGGEMKLAALASFDTLNNYILKGVKAPGMEYVFESLMTPSLDEPQSFYGLVAESVSMPDDRSSAEFTLRSIARWHDGTPITPDDVVFSFYTLRDKGDPSYKITYDGIEKVEKTAPDKVKFTFKKTASREIPLVAAGMPIISKAYYTAHDFEKTLLEPPMGSGPYNVAAVDPGRSISFERVKDYWGKDLPVNIGQYNFDTLRYDVYTDETVALEALKAGEYDFRDEYIARNWATAYKNIRATPPRELIKRFIPHSVPQGMQGFLFNTRKPQFSDRRVREAIGLALDFEWINKSLFYNAYERNTSFFQSTPFAATGLPQGAELNLLTPFKSDLPEALFVSEFHPPVTDGSGNPRDNLLRAQALLNEAGWVMDKGKRVQKATGEILQIEFLLRQPTFERVLAPVRKNLRKLGINASIRIVDDSQYQKRLDDGDFDLITIWINRGVFFPGTEQIGLWHSSQADIKGGNNLAGLKHPAVDAALAALEKAKSLEDLTPAGRALDRILLWEHVVIPNWHVQGFRVAYWNKFGLPDTLPRYGLGLMTWWDQAGLLPNCQDLCSTMI